MASSYLQPPSPRRRFTAIALTILVHILLLWLLLRLGPREFVPLSDGSALSTFNVAPDAAHQPRAERQRQQQRPAAAPRPQTAQPKPPPIPWKDTSGVIWLTREQFARTDIEKSATLPPRDGQGDAQTADAGADSGGPPVVGTAPGGGALYAAEWVREPTDAELAPFLSPPVPPGSWGIIACRTVAPFRVENCETQGESPIGSRIATGLRRAAWQFKVRPPRIGGTPQYGTWVRIKIEFTARGAQTGR